MKPGSYKNNIAKKAFFIAVAVALFFAALIQVSSERELVKYGSLEKEEIEDDDESQDTLREYYGEMLGNAKTKAKFNTVAAQGDIAVLNVTIDGKDTRIITRMREATISAGQADLTNAKLIRTESLVVLGNISLKENLFFEAENSFGSRRLYGIGGTNARYVDEGFSRLADGKANISINPVLRELIDSYNVFLSAEGLTKGIYVAEKANAYFVVKSVNANSNVGFSWMLSGIKNNFDEKLASEYGKEKGIGITAEINLETGSTKIRITGLDKIFALINEPNNNLSNENDNNTQNNNSIINETNDNSNNNQNDSQGIRLITGNLIDEFGLETDLGRILGERAELPDLAGEDTTSDETTLTDNTEEDITNVNETTADITDNITSTETMSDIATNETTPETSVLEFTLYTTDEEFVVSQISDVTGLSLAQVKKLINFAYAEPVSFEEEAVEEQLSLGFIEKINGSVIIKLG